MFWNSVWREGESDRQHGGEIEMIVFPVEYPVCLGISNI